MKRILVGLGCEQLAESVIRHALDLAQLHDATVDAVTVIDMDRLGQVGPIPVGGGAMAEDLREHRHQVADRVAESLIERFVTAAGQANVRHSALRMQGDSVYVLAQCARYYDLAMVGLHDTFDYGVHQEQPSNLVGLIRPMISAGVRPLLALPEVYQPVHRIVLSYGGSLEAAKAMRQFTQLQFWPDVEYHLLTVGGDGARRRELQDDACRYLAAYGIEPVRQECDGNPHHVILSKTEQLGAQIIVMGNGERNFVLNKIFGESVKQMLQQGEIGVFLS